MTKPSVSVRNVSKKFSKSLRGTLKHGLWDSGRRMLGLGKNPRLRPGEFWALRNVDFALEPGVALGIMGVNGSGKTTLLRILNGTYSPDAGTVALRGRIGALIAAGAGFSPMLTGRENVYISGTLLGMRPAEIRAKFDEIVAFADLGDFIDMPVRNYSSGMGVRLAFSVAVLGTPDILLVDEVLAVGDIAFQKKCYERIEALKREGVTILLVSHAPGAIWAVCDQGLLLHHGESSGIVPVEEACRLYEEHNYLTRASSQTGRETEELPVEYGGSRGGTGEVRVTKTEILRPDGLEPMPAVEFGADFLLRLHLDVRAPLREVILRVQLDGEINKAVAILDSYESAGRFFTLEPGRWTADILVRNPNLRPGVYSFAPSVASRRVGVHLYFEYNACALTVLHPRDAFLYADFRASVHLRTEYAVPVPSDPEALLPHQNPRAAGRVPDAAREPRAGAPLPAATPDRTDAVRG